ncbi:Ankyrin repeat-containing domain protein [Niveomyces insectorum RCEF 264]|uniref:Ankyrin repeat-containing domain protein n=1 Tax=Niveomyces insectorum RCEF 264 TaxID=1081102 RepID=A0A167PEN3_9HYPO|nr:Ankyrin repeat-containing domain protein [Niveomyces insectorum RCEF 264]
MDPLSITASVAGIVQLAGAVYQGIAKYLRDVKDASNDIHNLSVETRNLFGILNNLSLLISALEHDRFPVALQHSHLNACRQTLYTIDLRVNRAVNDVERGSKMDGMLRRLRWPFSKKETQDLLLQLSRHKDSISLALSADSMSRLLELLSTQQSMAHSVQGVAQAVQQLQVAVDARTEIEVRTTLTQQRRLVVEYFQSVNPQVMLEANLELRQDMTGLWLLKCASYQLWRDQPNGRIWLSGIPGSGKTVLCSAVVQDVLQRSNAATAVAFFFCDYKVPKSRLPMEVLGSLAVQLALQKPAAFTILEDYYNDLHPPNGLAKPPRLARMVDVAQRQAAQFDKAFLVVDALDECGSNTVHITEALKELPEKAANVSLAVLSRDEEHIRNILGDDFHSIPIAAQEEDLTLYLGSQMAKRKVFSNMLLRQPTLYNDIRCSLLSGAQGIEESRELIRNTLHWIAICSPPLTITQLCEAVSVREDDDDLDDEDIVDEFEIARVCSSLIRKTRSGRHFEFAHFTVREFLESLPTSSPLASFRFDAASATRAFAATSLRFLLLQKYSAPLLESERTGLNKENVDSESQDFFYNYAAAHWLSYAEEHFAEPDLLHLAGQLFDAEKTPQFCRFALAIIAYVFGHLLGGPDIKVLNVFAPDFSPLHLAAILGASDVCKLLIEEQGADPDVQSNEVGFPLNVAQAGQWALSLTTAPPFRTIDGCNRIKTIQIFMTHGASWTLEYDPKIDYKTTKNSPLHILEHVGDAALCASLVAIATSDPVSTTRFREELQLLMSSAKPFFKSLAYELVAFAESGAELTWTFKSLVKDLQVEGRHTLAIAPSSQFSSTRAPSNTLTPSGLADVLKAGDTTELKHLLSQRASACRDVRFANNQNLLHVAVIGKHLAATKLLLAFEFSVNQTDDLGETALHKCCADDFVHVARVLLQNGASSNAENNHGDTIWHCATVPGALMILDLLITFDHDMHLALARTNRKGYTPISRAIARGFFWPAKFLVERSDCLPEYFASPEPLALRLLAVFALDLVAALDKKNALKYCLFHEHGLPPLFYVGLETLPNSYKGFLPHVDVEMRYNGWSAAEYAIQNFWAKNQKLDLPDLYFDDKTFAALLTPQLIQTEGFDGKMLWEMCCLAPTGLYGPAHDLLHYSKITAFYRMLKFAAEAGMADSFEQRRSGVSAVVPLLPVLYLLRDGSKYGGGYKAKFWLYDEAIEEEHAATALLHILQRHQDEEHSTFRPSPELRQEFDHIIKDITTGKLPDLNSLTTYMFGMRDAKGRAANLDYFLTLPLPSNVFALVAKNIRLSDVAQCDVRVLARICQSLATGDAMLMAYYSLRHLSAAYDKDGQWVAARRPCAWPNIHDDNGGGGGFDWQQTFTIAYSCIQPDQHAGCTLLHAAALMDLTFVVDFLLQNKVFDVNVRSSTNCTPLLFAAIGRNPSTMRYLLSQGADASIGSKEGWRPDMFCEEDEGVRQALASANGAHQNMASFAANSVAAAVVADNNSETAVGENEDGADDRPVGEMGHEDQEDERPQKLEAKLVLA